MNLVFCLGIKTFFLHVMHSLVVVDIYFIEVSNHTYIMDKMHCEDQGATIRGLSTKKVSIRAKVDHSFEFVVI